MKINFPTKTYEFLKWMALVLLPAISMLYLALSDVWNLPYPNEVVGTIAAIDTFLGLLLGLSIKSEINRDFKIPYGGEFVLTDKTYDVLKWVAQILLPGIASLYFSLATLWKLPNPDQIVATIMALDTFLGMLLQISISNFNKYVRP